MEQYDLGFKGAKVYYIPNFISKDKADQYLHQLLKTLKFDKKEHEGRLTALHGSAKQYKYAQNIGVPEPWTTELSEIKDFIESYTGYSYDVCLLNYYKNGKESFAFHSDREELGNDIPIASISLGAERKFYFRSKNQEDKQEHCQILGHGSLLIMGPGTHENYLHSLPPDKKIKNSRLNLTFRKTRVNNNPTLARYLYQTLSEEQQESIREFAKHRPFADDDYSETEFSDNDNSETSKKCFSLFETEKQHLSESQQESIKKLANSDFFDSPLESQEISKTIVVNKKTTEDFDVFIGRPSKYGNPFVIGRDGDRETVINKYREWIKTQPELLACLHELKGKRIACFCKPLLCHGDILAELADST